MTDTFRNFRPPDDIEALIRSARDYVRPSDELRPRVLEVARSEHRERGMLWRVGLAVAFLLLIAARINAGLDRHEAMPSTDLSALRSLQILSRPDTAPRAGDAAWDMVESFTQLRERQAELLRL